MPPDMIEIEGYRWKTGGFCLPDQRHKEVQLKVNVNT